MKVLFLIFWGTSILFSILAVPIYLRYNLQGIPFVPLLHILTNICYFLSFWQYPFWQVWGDNLVVVLICISLMIDNGIFLFLKFIFRERRTEGEREGEKHQCVVASHTFPTGDLACNPGMCPDGESNQWPFGSQASTQSTEPHQPGHNLL